MPSLYQGKYWMLTIPFGDYSFPSDYVLPEGVAYLRGQLERGDATGYLHWQVLVVLERKKSMSFMRGLFGQTAHVELTRSEAAEDYVWKEDTRAGEPFEFGTKPFRRNNPLDWDEVFAAARRGELEGIIG